MPGGAVFSDVDSYGGLMELYDDDSYLQEHIQSSLWNFIRPARSGEVRFDGKYWNVFAKFQLNESYGAINDDERLPAPGIPKGDFAKYRPKLMYSQMEGTMFALTRGHAGGAVDGEYMDGLVKDTMITMMSNINFDLYGNGRGYRATVATATPAASSFTTDSTMRIRPGMLFDWYDSTLTTKRGSIAVALRGIDRMNKTVYIDSTFGSGAVPAGATADDVLVVYGALAANEPSDGRYMCGLDRMVDNSLSLGTLSPSSYAAWMATNINASGANPSQELLQQHTDQMYQIGGRYPNKMAFNTAWKRSYLQPFFNQRMFTSNSFDTGATSLTFSAVKMGQDEKRAKPEAMEMLEDKDCDPSKVYVWHDSALCRASDYADAPHLGDEDGSDFRMRFGYDSMQAFYRYWGNTVVVQRNLIGVQSNYATATGTL